MSSTLCLAIRTAARTPIAHEHNVARSKKQQAPFFSFSAWERSRGTVYILMGGELPAGAGDRFPPDLTDPGMEGT